MKAIIFNIFKTALALCMSTSAVAALAQTGQPEILNKQLQPAQDIQTPSGASGQNGTTAPVNPSTQAPAEQQAPSGEQDGSGPATPGAEQGSRTRQSSEPASEGSGGQGGTSSGGQGVKVGSGTQPSSSQPGEKSSGTTSDQKSDRLTRPGVAGQESGTEKGTQQGPGAEVSVTTEQKTEIRQVITETKVAPVRDLQVEISVGVEIPRTVEVHRLPPRIIEILPQYKDYIYFVLADGRIVILDPDTYRIVAIVA